MTHFKLKTLIDITNTGIRHDDGSTEYLQHQNYMTVINTIGLRANPINVQVSEVDDNENNFGNIYKNKKRVWVMEFSVEQEGATTTDLMISDFNGVPVITDLFETISLPKPVFVTESDVYKNIVFEKI